MSEYDVYVECKQCGAKFSSEAALKQHMKTKHGVVHAKKSKMNYAIGAFVVLVILILAEFFIFSVPSQTPKDALAQCLSEKGVTFYGTFWCPHCADQKKLFGSSVKYLPYVECSTSDGKGQLQVCTSANITGYPTWQFADGSRKSGTISLEELSSLSGCPYTP